MVTEIKSINIKCSNLPDTYHLEGEKKKHIKVEENKRSKEETYVFHSVCLPLFYITLTYIHENSQVIREGS